MDAAERRAIEWDCQQTLTRFINLLDARRYRDLAALFAPEGTWFQGGKPLRGPAAILAALESRPEAPSLVTQHVVTNIVIDIVDADHADAMTYLTVYRHDGAVAAGAPAPLAGPYMVGVSANKLVRGPGGWLIVEKRTIRNFERAGGKQGGAS